MPTQVWIDKDRIRIKSEFRHKDVCKAIPGARWDKERKCWHYPATVEVAGEVTDRFGHELQATHEFLVLAGRSRDAQEARRLRDREDLPPIEGEVVKSWLHQLQAHHFSLRQDAVMFAVDMGGGKSKVSIDLLETEEWQADRVLIICPNNVVKVWPREFAGAPDEDPPRIGHQRRPWRVVTGLRRTRNGKLVSGSLKERRDLFAAAYATASREHPVACVVNYEAAPQGALGEWLAAQEWDVILLDESQRIKSPGGTQSQFCSNLRPTARKRLCLSGTPMPHSPLDIYAQYRFLDPGIFGTSYARFRQRYAVMGGWQGKQVLGMNEATLPELHEKIARLAFIVTPEELDAVLGLEEPVWPDWRTAPLGAKARRAYDDLASDLITGIEEGVVTVNNALTQLLRLQQITSGHLPVERDCPDCDGYDPDAPPCRTCRGTGSKTEVVEVGTEKRDLFADWLTDLRPPEWSGAPFESKLVSPGEPVVVACRFIHDLTSVREVALAQGRRYQELSGRSQEGLTEHATMSPDCDVLGVQIQSGGVGIDLTRAHYVVNYSLGFSLGDFLQWLKRTHRPGQLHRVVYQNLAIEDTVDVAVYRALAARQEVVKAVIEGAKEAGSL